MASIVSPGPGPGPVFVTQTLAPPDNKPEQRIPSDEKSSFPAEAPRRWYQRKEPSPAVPIAAAAAAASAGPLQQSNLDRFAAIKFSYLDRFEAIRYLAPQIFYEQNYYSPNFYGGLKNLIKHRRDILIKYNHFINNKYVQMPGCVTEYMVREPNLVVTIFCPCDMSHTLIDKIEISLFFDIIEVNFKLYQTKIAHFKEDYNFSMSMLNKYLPVLPTNQPLQELVNQYLYIVGYPDLNDVPFGNSYHHGSPTYLKNLIAEQDQKFGRKAISVSLGAEREYLCTKGFRGSQDHREKLMELALEGLPLAKIQSVADLLPRWKSVFSGIPGLSFDLKEHKIQIKYNDVIEDEIDDHCLVCEIEKGQGAIEWLQQRLWVWGLPDSQGRLPSDCEHLGCPDWISAQRRSMGLSHAMMGPSDSTEGVSKDDEADGKSNHLMEQVRGHQVVALLRGPGPAAAAAAAAAEG